MTWLRVLERVHGGVGWLAAAALVHPAILLARPSRRARLAAWTGAVVPTLAGALGVGIYPEYRSRLKHDIFVASTAVGWAFERKEHLGVGAVMLAWAGLGCHLASLRAGHPEARRALARGAWAAFALAATMAVATAALGVGVASFRSF